MTTNSETLPASLRSIIGNEKVDFTLKAGLAESEAKTYITIFFGALIIISILFFVLPFFLPVFFGQEIVFTSNRVPTVAGPGNLRPLIPPLIIIISLCLLAIKFLHIGISSILKKGTYFVATPTRLIQYNKSTTNSVTWEQFSGNMKIQNMGKYGNLSLYLRTGKIARDGETKDGYVPDVIYISNIKNISEIEKICRTRISENEPKLT